MEKIMSVEKEWDQMIEDKVEGATDEEVRVAMKKMKLE